MNATELKNKAKSTPAPNRFIAARSIPFHRFWIQDDWCTRRLGEAHAFYLTHHERTKETHHERN